VAEDVDGKSETKFWLAAGHWLVAGVIALLFGFRQIYSWICLILCVFVASTVGLEFYRGAKVIRARSGASFAASAVELTMRNTRRYGGYIVHVGMVFVFIGLAGAAFNRDIQKDMRQGDTLKSGRTLWFCKASIQSQRRTTPHSDLLVEVLEDNKPTMMLYPEKRRFSRRGERHDGGDSFDAAGRLYVVYAGTSPDTQLPVIHAYLNPLVKWIWFGGW